MAGLMAGIAAGGCAPAASSTAPAKALFAYVGCYTTKERNGHGEGISVHRVDATSGTWTHVQLLPGIVNPSFLTLDHRHRFLYSAHGDGRRSHRVPDRPAEWPVLRQNCIPFLSAAVVLVMREG
jgi:hypothetical protein